MIKAEILCKNILKYPIKYDIIIQLIKMGE